MRTVVESSGRRLGSGRKDFNGWLRHSQAVVKRTLSVTSVPSSYQCAADTCACRELDLWLRTMRVGSTDQGVTFRPVVNVGSARQSPSMAVRPEKNELNFPAIYQVG